MKTFTSLLLALCCMPAIGAKNPELSRPSCATTYTIVKKDTLGNMTQGIESKSQKWVQGSLNKKYPDVCYAAPDPSVKTVFFIAIEPATYNGMRVVTTSSNSSGTVSGDNGNSATYQGTSTSSAPVPYSFDYGKYVLTIETFINNKPVARHRFAQDGIYRVIYGIPLGGRGHHPEKALIEDAVKWIHEGRLENPLQSAQ